MSSLSFAELELARIPIATLGQLAALRCEPSLEAATARDECWLRWEAGRDWIAQVVLAIRGCRLYGKGSAGWQLWGSRLPTDEVPDSLEFRPMSAVLFPQKVQPISFNGVAWERTSIRLVPSDAVQPTTAMQTNLRDLETWAANVPPVRLEKLQAARSGDQVLVLGKHLPWLEGQRYWGRRVLAPLGMRCDPALSEADLRAAFAVSDNELLILQAEGWEAIPEEAFSSIRLAGLRHVLREAAT